MNYPAIKNQLDVLFSLQRKEIKLGLEHTHTLLDYLHNPEEDLKMIHIAGTNGKGSTAAFISSILIQKGYRVGVFTSPHLIKFNERIRVNSNFITDLEILEFLDANKSAIKKIQSTFFETTTAMALSHFQNKDVDFAVIETGLGGRLDATNVIKPLVSLITSISLDHMDLLGGTIEKIAYEKAGIIKKNTPLIIGPNKKSVVDVFKKIAKKKESKIIEIDRLDKVAVNESGTKFECYDHEFFIPLIGKHQAQNASLAIAAARYCDSNITKTIIKRGLSRVKWAGRLHCVSKGIFYDVAHNQAGLEYLFETIGKLFPDRNLQGLLCLKGGKDIKNIAKQLQNRFKKLFVSCDRNGYLMAASDLSKKLDALSVKNIRENSLRECIKKLRAAQKPQDIILIFGTHYIAEEVFEEFEIPFDSVNI